MAGTLNPASPAFTLQERTRSRRDGGTAITDTYVGPTSGLDTFLAPYVGAVAPIPHPSHAGSVLDEIRERYDQSRTVVHVDLTYIPASGGYAYQPLRPVGSVVIEAEPVTEDISIDQWVAAGGSASDFAEGETSKSRPAIQLTVVKTERFWDWTQAALKALATGDSTPAAYLSGPLTAAAWSAAGCRVREGDGVAEKTQVWMFRPDKVT